MHIAILCGNIVSNSMNKAFNKENTKQFFSYFCVGGTSALVEWLCFSLLEYLFNVPYLLATITAFLISTTTNWFLGRTFTFKKSSYKKKKVKEFVLVFIVSAIGLGFNMLLMYLFVDLFLLNTNLLKTISKIIATGIVFIWNFVSRKLWIYKM